MQDFKKAYDSATFRQQGHDVVNLLADYLEKVSHKNEPTLSFKSPEAALDFWNEDFKTELLKNPTSLFEKVIDNSMHLHSPRYVGHQVTAPLPVAALAAFVDSFFNQ